MSGRERVPLFCEHDGSAVLRAQVEKAAGEVAALPEERILNTDEETLVRYFVEKYRVEVPTLDLDNVSASEHERPIEVYDHYDRGSRRVTGTAFDFEIPFTGDGALFSMRPNSWDTGPPYAQIREQKVSFSIEGSNLTEDEIRSGFERTRDSIQKYLTWHRELWRGLD